MSLGWETIPQAAKRLGRSERQLRRTAKELVAKEMARKVRPFPGEPERWEIRCDFALPSKADRDGAIPAPLPTEFNPASLGKANRNELYRREQIVLRWMERRSKAGTRGASKACDQFLKEIDGPKRPGRSTLYTWTANYESRGLAGLIDGRWLPTPPQPSPEAEKAATTKTDDPPGWAIATQTGKGPIRLT